MKNSSSSQPKKSRCAKKPDFPPIHGIVAKDKGDSYYLVRIGENGEFFDVVLVHKSKKGKKSFEFSVGDEINIYTMVMTMSIPPQVSDKDGAELVKPAADTEYKGWEEFFANHRLPD